MLKACAPIPLLPTNEQQLKKLVALVYSPDLNLCDLNLPARFFGEVHEIHVLSFVALDEFQAGVVLPVPHGLFRQRFAESAPGLVDFVGDDAVVPQALFHRGGCRSFADFVRRRHGIPRGFPDKSNNSFSFGKMVI